MNEFIRVGSASIIPFGGARGYSVGRYEVAVFNLNGEFVALENCCPHQGGPIAEGFLDGDEVTCPWHAWCFNVRTGKLTLGEYAMIPRFAVRVEGGDLLIAAEPESL